MNRPATEEILSEEQITALRYASSDEGGWPRAEVTDRSNVIVDYRALEQMGLVREIPGDAQSVSGQLRLHFVATEEGRKMQERYE